MFADGCKDSIEENATVWQVYYGILCDGVW